MIFILWIFFWMMIMLDDELQGLVYITTRDRHFGHHLEIERWRWYPQVRWGRFNRWTFTNNMMGIFELWKSPIVGLIVGQHYEHESSSTKKNRLSRLYPFKKLGWTARHLLRAVGRAGGYWATAINPKFQYDFVLWYLVGVSRYVYIYINHIMSIV